MHNTLALGTWGMITAGCPMDYRVTDVGTVEFMFGRASQYFEFGFDAGALREFVRLGANALAELDARTVQEAELEAMSINAGEPATAGARPA